MAIAFDNSIANSVDSTSTSITQAFTTSGTDRFLIVWINNNGDTVTGVTYGGVSMTDVSSISLRNCFVLENPTSGSNNIVVSSSSGAIEKRVMPVSYNGVAGGLDTVANDSVTGISSPFTSSITTGVTDAWIFRGINAGRSTTASTNSTFRCSNNGADNRFDCGYDTNSAQGAPGSKSMSVTFSATGNFSSTMVSLSPTAASSSTFIPKVIMY